MTPNDVQFKRIIQLPIILALMEIGPSSPDNYGTLIYMSISNFILTVLRSIRTKKKKCNIANYTVIKGYNGVAHSQEKHK